MPLAGAIAAALGGGALSTVASSVIVSFAVGAAEFAISSAFSSKKKAGQVGGGAGLSVNDAGLRQAVQQPLPPQRVAYGTVTAAGAVFFLESKDDGHLYQGYLLAAHECDGLEAVNIDGNEILIGADFSAQSEPYFDETQPWLYASFRSGVADQAIDPILAADFANLPGTFRQRGHATLVTKAFYGATTDAHNNIWPQGFSPLARFLGKKVYDPRKVTHSVDDPSTWELTDTASLIIADFLRLDRTLNGYGLASDRIDWATVSAAADRDEERVLLKNGDTEKRYSINGQYITDDRPIDILSSMLTANRGRVIISNGQAKLFSGGVEKPVFTLHQDLIAGPVRYRADKARREKPNVIRTEFVAPDRDYQPANGPTYRRDDLIASDGEERSQSVLLPWTEGSARASRLGKAALIDARLGRGLEATYSIDAICLEAGDVVNVEHPDISGGMADGTYMVERVEFVDNFARVRLAMTEYSPEIYDWDAAVDEPEFSLADIDLAA